MATSPSSVKTVSSDNTSSQFNIESTQILLGKDETDTSLVEIKSANVKINTDRPLIFDTTNLTSEHLTHVVPNKVYVDNLVGSITDNNSEYARRNTQNTFTQSQAFSYGSTEFVTIGKLTDAFTVNLKNGTKLVVNGTAKFNSDCTFDKNITVTKTATFNSSTTTKGQATFNNGITVEKGVTVGSWMNVEGTSTFTGTIVLNDSVNSTKVYFNRERPDVGDVLWCDTLDGEGSGMARYSPKSTEAIIKSSSYLKEQIKRLEAKIKALETAHATDMKKIQSTSENNKLILSPCPNYAKIISSGENQTSDVKLNAKSNCWLYIGTWGNEGYCNFKITYKGKTFNGTIGGQFSGYHEADSSFIPIPAGSTVLLSIAGRGTFRYFLFAGQGQE